MPNNKKQYNIKEEQAANTIGKILLTARTEKHYKQSDIVGLRKPYGIDIKPGAYSKWEKGDNIPNSYQLFAICDLLGITDISGTFTGMSSATGLNSAGERKVNEYIIDLLASGLYSDTSRISQTKRHGFVRLKVFDMAASAGTGSFVDSDRYTYVDYPKDAYEYGTDFGVRVSGDSMEPVYHDGQTVCVKKETELVPGDIGIFAFDGAVYIKQIKVEQQPDGRYTRYLISLNPAYKPIEIFDDSSFSVIGKVLS